MIIAVVGKNGSGKDSFVEHLSSSFGIKIFSMGDISRDLAKKEGVSPTRENLIALGRRWMTDAGQFFFPDMLIEKIKASGLAHALVSGVRPYSDVMRLREAFGSEVILVNVVVSDDRLRFERARARASERDPRSYEEFLRYDRSEEDQYHTSATANAADYVVLNDGSIEDLHLAAESFAAHALRLNRGS